MGVRAVCAGLPLSRSLGWHSPQVALGKMPPSEPLPQRLGPVRPLCSGAWLWGAWAEVRGSLWSWNLWNRSLQGPVRWPWLGQPAASTPSRVIGRETRGPGPAGRPGRRQRALSRQRFTSKQDVIRHYNMHKKRDNSLQHGFMRFSPLDDCSVYYHGCHLNGKSTHYHCMQVPRPAPPRALPQRPLSPPGAGGRARGVLGAQARSPGSGRGLPHGHTWCG